MRMHENVDEKNLDKEIKSFIGKIIQLPPVRSRVKRQEREREIKSFEILEIDGRDVLFLADVQAGTYIRKLIHDLGEKTGGAHMLELRRIKAGVFSEPVIDMYEFERAVDAWKKGDESPLREIIIPAEEMIKKVLPVILIEEDKVKDLLQGKPVHKGDIEVEDERFAIFSGERFIGVYKKVEEGEIISRAEFVYN